MKKASVFLSIPPAVIVAAIMATMVFASPGTTTLVTVASDGTQANSVSWAPSISNDGRYVAFYSNATNLVPGDTNNRNDVFVHDRQTGQTTQVSVASDGTQANSDSWDASISGDGRFVAFVSPSTNLVPGEPTGAYGVFVHDRVSGLTTKVSVSYNGTLVYYNSASPSLSAGGGLVAFSSQAWNLVPDKTTSRSDIFVRAWQAGQTTRVSMAFDGTEASNSSYSPAISGDGRFVAFNSDANNLVPGDTNNQTDFFVHDSLTGLTTRVSVASDGTQANNGGGDAPSISGDGRFVAFMSFATNLVPGDTNNQNDIFVHDRLTGETTRVSVASDGSQATGSSYRAAISGDGRYVAFYSGATNLVPGDTNGLFDVFVHDRLTGETTRVSVASDDSQANSGSVWPAINGDGSFVAFGSGASNLVPGDTNNQTDIFVHGLGLLPEPTPTPTPVPPTPTSTPVPPTPTPTPIPAVSGAGLVVLAGLLVVGFLWVSRQRRYQKGTPGG